MNIDIINKLCTEWDKSTWNNAYSQYCQHNQFGQMTKRQYYDFVCNNHKRLKDRDAPLSAELASKWSAGLRNALAWAKERGYVADKDQEQVSVPELAAQVRELEWRVMNK